MNWLLPVALVMNISAARAQDAEPPRTVNDEILGPVADFQDKGPARICLQDIAIDLDTGETATLQYAGIHAATLRVDGAAGELVLRHGNHWANRRRGALVVDRGGWSILRSRGKALGRYVLWAVPEYSGGEREPVLWLDGTMLKGDRRDLPILNRITFHSPTPANCARRYAYGWDMLLGDEPVSQRADGTDKP
ncbi:hypothetical protein ACG3SL_14195 [Sphingomonas sp. CJ20]